MLGDTRDKQENPDNNSTESRSINTSTSNRTNWKWDDPNEFWPNYNELPYPFIYNSHVGVSVVGDECNSNNGWELYTRRITNEDYGRVKEPYNPNDLYPIKNKIYFSLYNKRSGILRTFWLIQRDSYTSKDIMSIQSEAIKGTSSFKNYHGLAHGPGVSYSIDESPNFDLKQLNLSYKIDRDVWYIFDNYLAYDPNFYNNKTDNKNVYLNHSLYYHDESEVKLEGKLSNSNQAKSNVNNFSTIFNKITGAPGSITERSENIKEGVTNTQNYLKESNLLSESLKNSFDKIITDAVF